MFEVGVVARFEARHRLRGDFGPACDLHRHTYRIEVTARGPALGPDGTLCDLALIEDATRAAVGQLAGRDLDEIPAFQGMNTTAEVVARGLRRELVARLGSALAARGVGSLSVRVWESSLAWAAYEAEIG